jgi:hypothetical protein
MPYTPLSAPAQRTLDAIERATARFPGLSANGLTPYPGTTRAPIIPGEVETAFEFLSMLTPTKLPTRSSYALKHFAEAWGRRHELCRYVSNGALIAAAVWLGYTVEPRGPIWQPNNPNAGIGVSRRDLKRMLAAAGAVA